MSRPRAMIDPLGNGADLVLDQPVPDGAWRWRVVRDGSPVLEDLARDQDAARAAGLDAIRWLQEQAP